ncbi:NAD(P)-binding protein [Lophiostoma macrostomum CBS 122681]|uniref:NAD(P)-binding protein n=1 Tax=Lophiostoma macrostomum CBS 122681 TaxID=1314788 RepID=A0A6A6SZY3_9PLEO|nr:NAD(P)-binding protein [Lophiostoma macrostomum CBS 122681]
MAHVNRLQDARVLVFGGTSGIGFAVANLCLSQDSTVIISGSKQPKVDDKVALLRSYYPSLPADRISGLACDLADTPNLEANLTELFEKVTQGGEKKLDHISFTAGDVPKMPPLKGVNVEDTLGGFKIRFQSSVVIGKLLLTGKYVHASPSSSLTLSGGVNTTKPMPGWSFAAGFGGSVQGLTRGLAVDLKPIRVNIIEPGAIKTELWDGFASRVPGGAAEFEEMLRQKTLTGTVGLPSDTAEAYAWCMRDHFVTGTVAGTNGGSLLT